MVYTCTVKRLASSTSRDTDNQPVSSNTWVAHLTAQKCNLVTQMVAFRTGEQQDKDAAMVMSRYKLDFPYGTDVLVTDRVYDLVDRAGNPSTQPVLFYDIKEEIPSEISLSPTVQAIH
jgi:hypothetical protein